MLLSTSNQNVLELLMQVSNKMTEEKYAIEAEYRKLEAEVDLSNTLQSLSTKKLIEIY